MIGPAAGAKPGWFAPVCLVVVAVGGTGTGTGFAAAASG